jgi:hypothetical protein
VILPGIHLIFCIFYDVSNVEDGWKWFAVAILDFPVFIMVSMFHLDLGPFVEFTVLGTLWWLAVCASFTYVKRRMGA